MANIAHIAPAIDPLVELQKCFSLVKLSGELRIADRQEIADVLSGGRHDEVSFYKLGDAKLLMRRELETLPVSSKPNQVIDDFLVNPNTHVYDAVAFTPLPTPSTTLNYWVDSPVVPLRGSWKIIWAFLFVVICNGDRRLFKYLRRYLAHMLQKPEEKPGVMLVLLGGQGTGKGTFFELLGRVWPRTTLQVSDVDHVVGHFNACLERNYAICMDEAIFAGDKKARDRLKSYVTESHITIEQKHQPRREIESFHRFFAASNHEHFASVELDERRLVFFRVSDKHKEDHAYFDALHAAISDPAVISAMVHDLLALDLSKFNVRQRPKTAEHTKQKLQSLEGFDRYWFEVLHSGDLHVGNPEEFPDLWDDPDFVSTARLRARYQEFYRSFRQFQTLQAQDIRSSLRTFCPSAEYCRKLSGDKQLRGYDLPALKIARQEFEKHLGSKVDWGDEDSEADE